MASYAAAADEVGSLGTCSLCSCAARLPRQRRLDDARYGDQARQQRRRALWSPWQHSYVESAIEALPELCQIARRGVGPQFTGTDVHYNQELVRGVVLAGGLGSRLDPITRIINKHLLPVYDKPMIYYPIRTLVNAGIEDIMIVTGGRNAGDFLRLLGNGREFGLKHLDYTYQEGEGGIAEALDLARHFSEGEKLCVMLGDNIIEGSVVAAVNAFRAQERGARILLKQVPDPGRYGVPRFDDGRIVAIEEKPARPPSSFAVTGIYMFDGTVFDRISKLERSARGELEITDVNNSYIADGSLEWDELSGWWTDAGTVNGLLRASQLVAETGANNL